MFDVEVETALIISVSNKEPNKSQGEEMKQVKNSFNLHFF